MGNAISSVTIEDPSDITVDKLCWTRQYVYIDLGEGDVNVTVALKEMSLTDFVTDILRAAGVKHFSFNDVPSSAIEYHDADMYDDESEYFEATRLYNYSRDFGLYEDDAAEDDPVDEYGYSSLSYSYPY
jgi:hypothetical protein